MSLYLKSTTVFQAGGTYKRLLPYGPPTFDLVLRTLNLMIM